MREFPLCFPGVFPWTTQNKPQKASWNVFLDSIAAAQVYAYGFPTTLFADNACPLAVDLDILDRGKFWDMIHDTELLFVYESKPWYPSEPQITGKWMFIPPNIARLVLIHPHFWILNQVFLISRPLGDWDWSFRSITVEIWIDLGIQVGIGSYDWLILIGTKPKPERVETYSLAQDLWVARCQRFDTCLCVVAVKIAVPGFQKWGNALYLSLSLYTRLQIILLRSMFVLWIARPLFVLICNFPIVDIT